MMESNEIDLHLAVYNNKLERIKYLLQNGFDPNAKCPCHKFMPKGKECRGNTPFMMAVKDGNLDMIEIFLNNGCDIDTKDKIGNSPLHIAVKKYRLEMAKFLLQRGSNINVKNRQEDTPLQVAVRCGDLQMVKLLLEYDPDLQTKNILGRTALHLAVIYDRLKIIELLLKYGCDINVSDAEGFTALQKAIEMMNIQDNNATVLFLIKQIAKLRESGSYVCDLNMQLINENQYFKQFFDKYINELNAMKRTSFIVDEFEFTYFDILIKKESELEGSRLFTCPHNLSELIMTDNELERAFECYSSELKDKLNCLKKENLLFKRGNEDIAEHE